MCLLFVQGVDEDDEDDVDDDDIDNDQEIVDI